MRIPQCLACSHIGKKVESGLSCKAYPDGIPDVIMSGEHDHSTPYKGDNEVFYRHYKDNGEPNEPKKSKGKAKP